MWHDDNWHHSACSFYNMDEGNYTRRLRSRGKNTKTGLWKYNKRLGIRHCRRWQGYQEITAGGLNRSSWRQEPYLVRHMDSQLRLCFLVLEQALFLLVNGKISVDTPEILLRNLTTTLGGNRKRCQMRIISGESGIPRCVRNDWTMKV